MPAVGGGELAPCRGHDAAACADERMGGWAGADGGARGRQMLNRETRWRGL